MAVLLTYRLAPARQAAVRMICARLKIRARAVEPVEYGETLAALCGLEEKKNEPFAGETFEEEMLLMAGFAPQTLDAFLRAFRSCLGAPVALKAVLTETNAGWDSVRLHEELCRERDALSRGGKAHRE